MIVGFTNGCFDLFHEGHRHFLTQCRRHCDYLIVAVNSDAWCKERKGEGRPVDGIWARMMHVRQIAEAVFPFDGYEEGLLVHIRPHVFFKGYDHALGGTPYGRGSAQIAAGIGAQVVRISQLEGFSTTQEIQSLAERGAKG